MLTKENIIQILQKELPYLTDEFGVRSIGFFGSYAKGLSDATSDIDLVVDFERPIGFKFLELVDYLEGVLGRTVDVVTPAGIDNIRIGKVARNISEGIVYV